MKKLLLTLVGVICSLGMWADGVASLPFTAKKTIAAGGEIWWTTAANVAAANTAGWCSVNTNSSNNKKGNITPKLTGDEVGDASSYSMDGVLVKTTNTPTDLTTAKKALVFKVTNTTEFTVYGGTTGSSQAVSVHLSVYKADGTAVAVDQIGVGAAPNNTCTTTVSGLDEKETYVVNVIGGLKATDGETPATNAGGQDMVVYAIKFAAPSSGKTPSDFALTSANELLLAPAETSQITTSGNAGTVAYSTGDENVVEVSNTGIVTGVAGGVAVVTASDPGTETVDGRDLTVTVKVLYAEDKTSSTFKFDNAGYYLTNDGKWYFKNGWSITTDQGFQYAGLTCNDKANNGFKANANRTYTINVPEGVTIRSAKVTMRSNYGSDKTAANWGTIFGQDLSAESLPFSSEEAATKEFDITNETSMTFTPGGNQCQMYIELSTMSLKQNSDLALSSNAVEVSKNRTASVSFTSSSTGAVTATSDKVGVATAVVDGNNIVVTGVSAGTATITIAQESDENYKEGNATIMVTVNDPTAPTAYFSATATTAYSVPKETEDGSLDGYVTVTGGSMTVYNGQTSAKDLIKSQASTMAFSATNNNTYFKATLDKTIKVGDVISIDIYGGVKNGDKIGLAVKTDFDASEPDVVLTTDGQTNWETYSYTIKEGDDIVGATTIVFCRTIGTTTYFANIKISRPVAVSVTVTDAGMATFTPSVDLDFTNAENIKAYTGAVSGDAVTLTEVTKVKAGEGVLLVAEGGATEIIDVAAEAVAAAEGNAFVGVLTDIPALATEGENCTNYILNNGSQGIGFYWANGQAVDAGKAYLKVPAANPARALRLVFGESTAINNVNANATDNVYYNLAGQRVNAQTKGIVVVNGKKLINK